MMLVVAFTFHFQPSDLWEMDFDELEFWHRGIGRVAELMK